MTCRGGSLKSPPATFLGVATGCLLIHLVWLAVVGIRPVRCRRSVNIGRWLSLVDAMSLRRCTTVFTQLRWIESDEFLGLPYF